VILVHSPGLVLAPSCYLLTILHCAAGKQGRIFVHVAPPGHCRMPSSSFGAEGRSFALKLPYILSRLGRFAAGEKWRCQLRTMPAATHTRR